MQDIYRQPPTQAELAARQKAQDAAQRQLDDLTQDLLLSPTHLDGTPAGMNLFQKIFSAVFVARGSGRPPTGFTFNGEPLDQPKGPPPAK